MDNHFHYKLGKDNTKDIAARNQTPTKKPALTPVKKTLTPVRKPYRDMKIPFGKHKGEIVADIPNSYLEWLLDQDFFEEKFSQHYEMAKQEMDYRNKFDIYI